MANKKISELPAASALTGAELLEVVQSGTSKQSTASAIQTFMKGSPSTLYVAVDTYANIVAGYPAASFSGANALATDLNGCVMVSNGSRWIPRGGNCTLNSSGVPVGIAPSGTINAGGSGNLTLGTALNAIYNDGIWLYLPAKATTPALSAGLYWVVMSSTTLGTIYSAGPGSSAINFTAGTGAYTGVTTSVTLVSTTIPAGLLGTSGSVTGYLMVATSNNANSKTTYQHLGGVSLGGLVNTGQGFGRNEFSFFNIGSAARQTGGMGLNIFSPAVAAIDTSVSTTHTLVSALSVATDYIIITGYNIQAGVVS